MRNRPVPGEKYLHFKNKLYQIVTIAHHSETDEELVIYQALYEPYMVCARPLEMFLSEVDHEKYPDLKQKYCFKKLEAESKQETYIEKTQAGAESESYVEKVKPATTTEEQIHPKLLAFLDMKDMQERYELLASMRECITDEMIDTMAVVLDTVIPEGDLQKRYEDLKHVIRTRQQYESVNRLR